MWLKRFNIKKRAANNIATHFLLFPNISKNKANIANEDIISSTGISTFFNTLTPGVY